MRNLMLYAANKLQVGDISPANFNLLINQGQRSYLNYLFGQVQEYQPGRPVSRVSVGLTQTVREILTAFIDPPTTLTIDNTGLAPYPTDFQRVDTMYTTTLNRIKFVQQPFLWSTLLSRINPVASNPIYLMQSDGFQFYPNLNFNGVALSQAKLSYVKTPPDIVWGFTDPSGVPIYDPTTSKDPVWYDLDCLQVIVRALRIAGVNLQANVLSQYAEEIKNNGE